MSPSIALFTEALDQLEEARDELVRLIGYIQTPGVQEKVTSARARYDAKRKAVLEYVEALQERRPPAPSEAETRPHCYAIAIVGFQRGGPYQLSVFTNNARSEDEAIGTAVRAFMKDAPNMPVDKTVLVEIPQVQPAQETTK